MPDAPVGKGMTETTDYQLQLALVCVSKIFKYVGPEMTTEVLQALQTIFFSLLFSRTPAKR